MVNSEGSLRVCGCSCLGTRTPDMKQPHRRAAGALTGSRREVCNYKKKASVRHTGSSSGPDLKQVVRGRTRGMRVSGAMPEAHNV